MKSKIEFIIVFVLLASSLFSVGLIRYTSYTADVQLYLGFVAIFTTAYFLYSKHKKFSIVLLTILLLGTVKLISFSLIGFGFYFSIGKLNIIGFDPLIFLLLILYVVLQRKRIMELIQAKKELLPELKEEEK